MRSHVDRRQENSKKKKKFEKGKIFPKLAKML